MTQKLRRPLGRLKQAYCKDRSSVGHKREINPAMIQRLERLMVGGFIWAMLLTMVIAPEHKAWADQPGQTAPANSAAPAASATPAAAAAAPTPVPPLSSPAMTGPLVMASPNEINIPKYVPFLSDLPAPIANLLDFDVNGVVSGLGLFQNHAVVGDPTTDWTSAMLRPSSRRLTALIQYYRAGGRLWFSHSRQSLYQHDKSR